MHMNRYPVTGLAHLTGQILPSVHMGSFSQVTKLRYYPCYSSYGKFQLGYLDEPDRPFKFHTGDRAGVFIWKNC